MNVLDVVVRPHSRNARSLGSVHKGLEHRPSPLHGISKAYGFWLFNLKNCPDIYKADKVLAGIKNGFDIGFKGERVPVFSPNWNSALKLKDKVTDFVFKHLSDGSVERVHNPSKEFRASPLGAFMKKHSDKVRVIHDLSWPTGCSTNDGIDKDEFSVSYTSVDQAVLLCSKYEQAWLAKTDLQDAYLSCPVNVRDRDLLGFKWSLDGEGVLLPLC